MKRSTFVLLLSLVLSSTFLRSQNAVRVVLPPTIETGEPFLVKICLPSHVLNSYRIVQFTPLSLFVVPSSNNFGTMKDKSGLISISVENNTGVLNDTLRFYATLHETGRYRVTGRLSFVEGESLTRRYFNYDLISHRKAKTNKQSTAFEKQKASKVNLVTEVPVSTKEPAIGEYDNFPKSEEKVDIPTLEELEKELRYDFDEIEESRESVSKQIKERVDIPTLKELEKELGYSFGDTRKSSTIVSKKTKEPVYTKPVAPPVVIKERPVITAKIPEESKIKSLELSSSKNPEQAVDSLLHVQDRTLSQPSTQRTKREDSFLRFSDFTNEGSTFWVQIAMSPYGDLQQVFTKQYGITKGFRVLKDDFAFIYFVGPFRSYSQAFDYSFSLNNKKAIDTFPMELRNGKRIRH